MPMKEDHSVYYRQLSSVVIGNIWNSSFFKHAESGELRVKELYSVPFALSSLLICLSTGVEGFGVCSGTSSLKVPLGLENRV